MNNIKGLLLTLTIIFLAGAGCVRRIVIIDSQPQGARVYFDRKLIGKTPCTYEFLYYGTHHVELVKEGYANLNTSLKLKGPIYEFFPLSVFSELLIPWQITDEHKFTFKLEKGQTKEPIISPIKKPQLDLPPPKLERIEPKQ